MKRRGNVLVVFASRHRATEEIASVIAAEIASHAVDVTIADADERPDLTGCSAVIIGSAVYMGRWQKTAKDFVEENVDRLSTMPVWLFSSGPIGDPAGPAAPPDDGEYLQQVAAAREHKVFCGKLEKTSLGMRERMLVRASNAPYGDFRDWNEIRDWGAKIAARIVLEHAA